MIRDIKPVKVNFNLRHKQPVDKPTSIHCVVRFNNQRLVLSNIDNIEPRYWNEKVQRARNTLKHLQAASLNDSLDTKEAKIRDAFRTFTDSNNRYPSVELFREICKKVLNNQVEEKSIDPVLVDLISYTNNYINEAESGKRQSSKGKPLAENTIKIFRTFVKNLMSFKETKKYDLGFVNMTLDFFEEFKAYLTFDRKYATNTVSKHIRILKSLINEARDEGLSTATFSGKRYQATSEETESIYLNPDELQHLFDLDLSNNSKLDKVRDLFLVGCWTGLRFSDFSSLSGKNFKDGFIEIQTQKTSQKVVIPIHQKVVVIMNKYQNLTANSLPPSLSNQKMNQYLKELGAIAQLNEIIQVRYTKAGRRIEKSVPKHSLISTHTARRSFATNMYNMGIPTLSIMALTSHRTESSFMKYIKVTPREHANKIKSFWHENHLELVS